MGDMADYYIDLGLAAEAEGNDWEPESVLPREAANRTCSHCGKFGLVWVETGIFPNIRYQLFEKNGRKQHLCSHFFDSRTVKPLPIKRISREK